MCLAIPGKVLDVYRLDDLLFADVRFGTVTSRVCVQLQPDVSPGDFVLVHVGLAISRIEEEEAVRTWNVLQRFAQSEQSSAADCLRATTRGEASPHRPTQAVESS